MFKVCVLITLFTYIVCVTSEILFDTSITHLDILLQNFLRYKYHHHRNYQESLSIELIPSGLHLKNSPAFDLCQLWKIST